MFHGDCFYRYVNEVVDFSQVERPIKIVDLLIKRLAQIKTHILRLEIRPHTI